MCHLLTIFCVFRIDYKSLKGLDINELLILAKNHGNIQNKA